MEALSLDLEAILPASSVAKARRLLDLPTALHGALRAVAADEEEVRARAAKAATNLREREQAMLLHGRQKNEDLYNLAREAHQKEVAELKRRAEATKKTAEPWQAANALAEALKNFMGSSRVGRIHGGQPALKSQPIEPVVVADPFASIEECRAAYADFDGQEEKIRRAPCPSSEIRQRLTGAVDRIANEGAPSIDTRIRDDDPAKLADRLSISLRGSSFLGDAGASFFVWLLRDEIVNRLTALVDAEDAADATTDADRNAALAALARRRLEAERREEALILGAEARGIAIARRPNADPRAVLEVEVA